MTTTQPWWKRFLGEASEISPTSMVTTGIIRRGPFLELCPVSDQRRGVMLVTMPAEQLKPIEDAIWAYKNVQAELRAMPRKRRAKKRWMKVVPLPPNPSPDPPRVEVTP